MTTSSSSALRIGIDFDNTIAGYDAPFCVVARELGLVPAEFVGTKQAVRSAVRLLEDGERHWQRLQGQVYGARMDGATLFDGVMAFFESCRRRPDTEVFIISHKTQYGHFDEAQVDLRAAARRWLTLQGFFDFARFGLTPDRVFFETTRAEKIARIGAVGCTHFIDDLEEVLDDPAFPADVSRILFTNGQQPTSGHPYRVCESWAEIGKSILGTHR